LESSVSILTLPTSDEPELGIKRLISVYWNALGAWLSTNRTRAGSGIFKGSLKASTATNNLMATESKHSVSWNLLTNLAFKVVYHFLKSMGIIFYVTNIISNLLK
jgi:hypothetical protein